MKHYFFVLLLVFAGSLAAQPTNSIRKSHYNISKTGLAVAGYDVVAYFTAQKAVKGRAEFSTVFQDITYHFSFKENKDLFLKNPLMYEPQYGGWCAYAMGSDGSKVEVDPETFKVLNGKLYLFYHSFFNNTLKSWNKNEANLKIAADNNWNKIIH